MAMDELHEACRTGTPPLETLLSDPTLSGVPLDVEPPQNKYVPRRLNLERLMCTAAESGQLSCVQALLNFGHVHNIHYDTFISRGNITAALKGKNDAILKEFIKAWPEVVNLDMGHAGHPLMQTLLKDNFHLSEYLLNHGAHANAVCGPDKGLGGCIRRAAGKLPLRYTTLLLSHGAQVAQSGAIRTAAEKGRLDVLKLLIEHGGDVNERLEPDAGFFKRELRFQKASETPLFVATANGHRDVMEWLLEHGADREIGDLIGRTPGMLAREMGDEELMRILGEGTRVKVGRELGDVETQDEV